VVEESLTQLDVLLCRSAPRVACGLGHQACRWLDLLEDLQASSLSQLRASRIWVKGLDGFRWVFVGVTPAIPNILAYTLKFEGSRSTHEAV